MKRFWSVLLFLFMIMACKEVYETPPQALLQASILNSSTKKTMNSTITLFGVGLDSLWLYETDLSTIMFPLNGTDTSKFIIALDSKTDTLTFYYKTIQKYASMETGFYYEFMLKEIKSSHSRIDSIQITDSLVTKSWHENIKLYIRPLSAGTN